jgi:hypothetical protein
LSEARLTDERLRSWLNADQASRERMCCAILACDRKYRDVAPQRPEGGPDGGSDLQASQDEQLCTRSVFLGGTAVWIWLLLKRLRPHSVTRRGAPAFRWQPPMLVV